VPQESLPSRRQWARRYDVAGALLVAVVEVTGSVLVAASGQADRRPLDVLAFVLLVSGAAALAVRRTLPVPVLAVAFCTTLLYYGLGYPTGPAFLSILLALYTATVIGRRAAALVVAVLLQACMVTGFLAGHRSTPDLAAVFGVTSWLVVVLVTAEAVRGRRKYLHAVEQRAIEAERSREEEALRRATQERLRIARELHDALAHNISLINVQAGVALHLMDEQPGHARTALVSIKQASKEALQELRSTLKVLRHVDGDAPRSPAPGLARMRDLIEHAAATGLTIQTEVEGEPHPLSPGADLAAYRILQEALTNVFRHADAKNATVRLDYGERDLRICVEDDGHGPMAAALGGNGISGMRERAVALGGHLDAGARPGGGFRVRARLPLGREQ
jgi:signal transduction histidine kinase